MKNEYEAVPHVRLSGVWHIWQFFDANGNALEMWLNVCLTRTHPKAGITPAVSFIVCSHAHNLMANEIPDFVLVFLIADLRKCQCTTIKESNVKSDELAQLCYSSGKVVDSMLNTKTLNLSLSHFPLVAAVLMKNL